MVLSDEQLLKRFLGRKDELAEAAFAELIERHGPLVHRVCLDVLGDPEAAQDAAQVVFLVLARKAQSIRKPASLGPWLHGVALRVARRVRSETARRKVAERKKAEIMHERQIAESRDEPMDHAELHAEIDQLPEKYRWPIILCYMQGQTQTQAAETLGWPLGTVQIRLHRGREQLRSRLIRRDASLSRSALLTSLTATSSVPERNWSETTARAAVRFAAGNETAGLVTPAVTGLAQSMLAAMIFGPLKILALLAIALVLAWAGLSSSGPATDKALVTTSHVSSALSQAATVHPRRELKPSLRKAPEASVVKNDQATRSGGGDRREPTGQPTPIVILPEPHVVAHVLSGPPASSSQSQSLALMGLRSEKMDGTGRELFERVWVKDDPRGHGGDGLGPVFNGQACVACHNLGGTGGAGGIDRNIEIANLSGNLNESMGFSYPQGNGFSYSFSMDFGAGRFEYRMGGQPDAPRRETRVDSTGMASIHPGFRDSRSVVLHRFGTDPAYNAWRGSVPGQHGSILVRTSQRNPPPLFGAGLIDAIPDAVIEAAAKRKLSGQPTVKGRVSRLKDGRIGRFGWKAQTATLEEFVLSAAAGEMGLEVPGRQQAADPRLPGLGAPGLDMDEADCKALVSFVRSLPAPIAIKPVDEKQSTQIKSGEETFKSIGCIGCHLAKLGDVTGIYSDLLLHDMGPRLADSDAYAVFVNGPPNADGAAVLEDPRAGSAATSVREWRTPPLWGLRHSVPYLHDGRAASIEQAITMHAGQGATSAKRYAELPSRRKQNLEAFLMSLTAPSPKH